MWLRLQPASEIEIDVRSPVFEDLLSDPVRTGNRRIGWHFARASEGPGLAEDSVWWRSGKLEASVFADGGMRFSAALRSLHWKGEDREIWPWALLEYPISAFRLAREIYRGHGEGEERLLADLALFGIRGWKLAGGSPSATIEPPPMACHEAGDDLIWEKPLSFTFREILDTPDRCGYRLVRRVYEAFGFGEDEMPCEFDHASGRLVLPDG